MQCWLKLNRKVRWIVNLETHHSERKLKLKPYRNGNTIYTFIEFIPGDLQHNSLIMEIMEIETTGSDIPCSVHSDNIRGRHLIATRSIREGELIFEETPLIAGPCTGLFYEPARAFSTCLGCYKHIQSFYRCSKCGWPVCGIQCENVSLFCFLKI